MSGPFFFPRLPSHGSETVKIVPEAPLDLTRSNTQNASISFHEFPANPQPKTVSVIVLGREEWLKDSGFGRIRHSRTGIGYGQENTATPDSPIGCLAASYKQTSAFRMHCVDSG
jgi:hypothetical protein